MHKNVGTALGSLLHKTVIATGKAAVGISAPIATNVIDLTSTTFTGKPVSHLLTGTISKAVDAIKGAKFPEGHVPVIIIGDETYRLPHVSGVGNEVKDLVETIKANTKEAFSDVPKVKITSMDEKELEKIESDRTPVVSVMIVEDEDLSTDTLSPRAFENDPMNPDNL